MAAQIQNRTERLGQAKINKLLVELALPAIVAQLVNLLYSIVDRIYIGRIAGIGSVALSGLGIATPIIFVVSAFSAFSVYGGAPLASLALGAMKDKKARSLLESNTVGTIIIALLLTLLTELFLPNLLYAFGAQSHNYPYAEAYLRIYLSGTLFVFLALSLNSFIAAQGEVKIAMRTVIIGALVNVVLDPLFIFVFKLGIAGAAYATVIAQFCSMLAVLYFLCRGEARLALRKLSFNISLYWESVRLGVSGFIMMVTESAVIVIYNRLLAAHGGPLHVANMVILQSVTQILFIPMGGYISGVQPLLSYNYGARNYGRVREILLKSAVILLLFSLLIAGSAAFFPQLYSYIFTSDKNLHALVIRYLPVFISGMMIFGCQQLAQMFFVGTNQVLKSISLALLRKVVLMIPLSLLLSHYLGLFGIYLSESLADAASASIAAVLFGVTYRKLFNSGKGNSNSQTNC